MKKIILSVTLLLGIGVFFAACNHGAYTVNPASGNNGVTPGFGVGTAPPIGTGGNGGTAAAGTLTCKVNGTQFTAATMYTSASLLMGTLNIGGIKDQSGSEAVNVLVENYNGAGSYTLDSDAVFACSYVKDLTNAYRATKGTVKVTTDAAKANDYYKGTFEFSATNPVTGDKIEITEGSFNVKRYQ